MTRFPALSDDPLDEAQQRMAAIAMRTGPYQAFLRAPVLWEHLQPLRRYLANDCVLAENVREAAILALARHWNSTAAFAGHVALAQRAGLDDAAIHAIGCGEMPPQMKGDPALAIECVVSLLDTHGLDDVLFDRARSALGERGIIELVGLVGFFTTIALTLNVAGISGKAPFAPAPGAYSPADKSETDDSQTGATD